MKTMCIAAGLTRAWNRFGDALLAVASFLLSLALYLRTLAPSVATLFDDSLEFPLLAHRLAIAHPTGYPLYTLLARLFSWLPWRDVAGRVNLLSAVAGALTVALVYGVARQLTRRRGSAFLAAAALALSPVFWSQAVIAEVYTLNSAFVVALLWLALRWAREPFAPLQPSSLLLAPRQPRPPAAQEGGRIPPWTRRAALRVQACYRRVFPAVPPRARLRLHPRLYALAALYGLSLTHHRTVLLLAPALLLFLLLVDRRVLSRAALLGPDLPGRSRWLGVATRPVVLLVICLLLPLLLYLYLPLRGHVGSIDGTYVNSWAGFWRWVTASSYSAFLGKNPLARDLDAAFYVRLFWQQFGAVGLALALVGLIGLARRRSALALTVVAFASYVAFALLYRVPDVEVFFLPAFLIVAMWIGAGLDHAADLLRVRGSSMAMRRILAASGVLLSVAAFLQPALIGLRAFPEVDLSQRWEVHDWARTVLEQPLPADSTVVGLLGEMTLLRTFQETAGIGTHVATVVQDDPAARLEAVQAELARGRAVYITRSLPGVAERYSLSAVIGPVQVAGHTEALVRVSAPGTQVPTPAHPTNLEPVPGLHLLGYEAQERRAHWQAWLRLRLWWQAPRGLAESLKISARLIDASGQVVAALDAEPVAWTYSTQAWRPGEVVADAYEIPLPAGTAPGQYAPLIVVYDPQTGIERGRIGPPPVMLEGTLARPPRRDLEATVGSVSHARFGDVALLGFTAPSPDARYRPGDAVPLTLLWQARRNPTGELRLSVWLEGGGAHGLAQTPLGGEFPASRWSAGQVVRQTLVLRVPEDLAAGIYRLRLRVTRDGRPVPWGLGFLPLGNDLPLGRVQVGP